MSASDLDRYKQLTKVQLAAKDDDPSTDSRLDEMDDLWYSMTEEERTEARHYAVECLKT